MQSHYERTGRLCRKIDVYAKTHDKVGRYVCSTNWHKTCREAIESVVADPRYGYAASDLYARFDKRRA
jgi:hypothetical protein